MKTYGTHELITLQEAAELVRVSKRTIQRAVKDGKLPAYAYGRNVRLKPAEVAGLFTPLDRKES